MRLSTRTRYGLRAMASVARHGGEFATSELLAASEGLSKKYLDAILGQLREAGLLEAARGQHGGYRLTRPAEEITAADVVDVLDGGIAMAPCLEDASRCARAPRCPTRPVWRAASKAMREALAGLTLADLASRQLETAEATYAI